MVWNMQADRMDVEMFNIRNVYIKIKFAVTIIMDKSIKQTTPCIELMNSTGWVLWHKGTSFRN